MIKRLNKALKEANLLHKSLYERNIICTDNVKRIRYSERLAEQVIKITSLHKRIDALKLDALKAKIADDNNVDFESWWEMVKKMYTISNYKITSLAANWTEEKSWQYSSELQVLEQLDKLVKYKLYDRERGHGSYEQDADRVEELLKTQ